MLINIVFTAYNRPDYLRQTLSSWRDVRGVDQVSMHMFLEPSQERLAMVQVVEQCGLPIELHLNSSKQGVLHNPWQAMQWSFSQTAADFTILAEDDIIVSSDVLEYFELACKSFGPQKALGVCSYTANLGEDKFHVKLVQNFEVLIWGTWRDSWESHIRDTWDHDYSTNSGTPGQNAGWDHNLSRLSKTVLPFVHPEVSRCKHIGREGGTHMTSSWFDTLSCPTFQLDRELL